MKTYENDEICTLLAVECKAEGQKAFLFEFGDGEEHWLPKSEIDFFGDVHDRNVEIGVPFWLCEKRGLEDYIID